MFPLHFSLTDFLTFFDRDSIIFKFKCILPVYGLFVFIFETRSCSVAQVGLELKVLLLQA
jgi:hypothetical protein